MGDRSDPRASSTGNTFSKTQLLAIELLAQGHLKQTAIQKRCKISHTTLWDWKQNPQFIEAVVRRAYEMIDHALPKILLAMIEKATKGSYQHAKLLFEHIEKIEKLRSQYADRAMTFTWNTEPESKGFATIDEVMADVLEDTKEP